jgi:hypothetical protein
MDWSKYQEQVVTALQKYGVEAKIIHKELGEYDIVEGKKTENEKESNSVFILFKSNEYEHEILADNELLIFCSKPSTISLIDTQNKVLKYNDKEYVINKSKPVMPGGSVLMYKLFCQG